jgi:hypothetical protein
MTVSMIQPKVKPDFSIAIPRILGRMLLTSRFNDFPTIGLRSIAVGNESAAIFAMRCHSLSS